MLPKQEVATLRTLLAESVEERRALEDGLWHLQAEENISTDSAVDVAMEGDVTREVHEAEDCSVSPL